MKVRVAGVWKTSDDIFVRVSGTWRNAGQGFVRVSGTWRRFHRRQDLLINSNIVLEQFDFLGNTYYGAQNDASGNSVLGSMSNKYLTTGRLLANMQTGAVSNGGYGPRRWMDIYFSGNVPGLDIPSIEYAGQKSVAVIANGVYTASPYNVTVYTFGFAADLPISGTRLLRF